MSGSLQHGVLTHPVRVAKAVLTNQIARFSPSAYVRMTGETGRGQTVDTAEQTAAYFRQCIDDYFDVLGLSPTQAGEFLAGQTPLNGSCSSPTR